ncbi:MAG: VWA domain-containing protein [Planctomycetaceae bacterium]|jgi:uncharacterized protein YegL|nr:VWA domain-containing protein [Planctomycetaceae bacterium]
MTFDPSKFTVPTAKPLPVILLLDVSSSMSGSKIDNLNKAVQEMLNSFAQEEKMETEILVSIITFGAQVFLHTPLTKASEVRWKTMIADGMTPMGTALKMAKAMIEDKNEIPPRAYRPTVVLVSDGQPNDDWENPLDDFINNGRSAKCDRMAMAIGIDADHTVLTRFVEGTMNPLFSANQASKIHEFFKRVTMSVTMRTKSKKPNESILLTNPKLDGGSIASSPSSLSDKDVEYW